MKYAQVKIRKATKSDLLDIFRIEKASYTPMLQATHKILEYRMKTFGIWVAEVDGKIRGFFTCIPAELKWPKPDTENFISNRKPYYLPWFKKYEKGGDFNTLIVSSTAVESKYQGVGIGTELVKFSLVLAKEFSLPYRASALRCEYRKYFEKTGKSISDYIQAVKEGKEKDRFLGPYLRLGFEFGPPLPNYEPYKGSLGFNIFAYIKV